MKKKLSLVAKSILVLTLCAMLISLGCNRTTTGKGGKDPDSKRRGDDQTPLEVAAELLRHDADMARCQEAIQLVNSHLLKNKKDRERLSKFANSKTLLRDTFHLTDEELTYLAKNNFTPLDTYHVEWCFRLREAAKALRLAELTSVEAKVKRGFDWVMRQVILDSASNEDLLPPQFVLLRGRGSAQERSLVFLALMHQLDLPGCMIAVPSASGKEKRYWLPGVLFADKSGTNQIHVFETRLGVPLPGPDGKGIATLKQLRDQPDLLKQVSLDTQPYDVTADQVKKAEVHLVCPLSALSPRMQFLQQELKTTVPIKLAVDPKNLWKTFQKVDNKVFVWNTPKQGKTVPNSPVRTARHFLPDKQGGVGDPIRHAALQFQRTPWWEVNNNYDQLGVTNELLARANTRLQTITAQFLDAYVVKPREHLTRGNWGEELTKPIVRIRQIIKQFRQSEFYFNPTLRRQQITAWRQQLLNAYRTFDLGDRGQGQALLNRIWGDQYLLQLTQVNKEDTEIRSDYPKTTLSYIVMAALEKSLSRETDYLLAISWLEKAERSQQHLDHLIAIKQHVTDRRRNEVRDNWTNAIGSADSNSMGHGQRYVNLHPISPSAINSQLLAIERLDKNNISDQLTAWEDFFKVTQRCLATRLHIADGLTHAGREKEADRHLTELQRELSALRNNATLKKQLSAFVSHADKLRPLFRSRPRLLLGILEDGGSFAWYSRAVAYRLGRK